MSHAVPDPAATSATAGGPPRIAHDVERVALLHALQLLDTGVEASFDAVTRLAAQLTGRPIALVGLVDTHRTFFKSRFGTEVVDVPRDVTLCSYTIAGRELFEVPDTHADPRFRDNPLVTGETQLRFYAGVPLVIDGHALGTVCVADRQAYRLDDAQRAALHDLGRIATELLERRLANRAKSRFISSMSHEMRTPLNAVLGFGQVLQREFGPETREARLVGHVVDGGRQLLGLVDEVLDFMRLEAGVEPAAVAPTDLAPIVREVRELLGPTARERGIALHGGETRGALWALAEPLRVRQALLHLVGHAIRQSPSGGDVRLRPSCSADGVEMAVADSGDGLSLAQMQGLFRPFERPVGEEGGGIVGTGLGLALAQRLAEAMGGDIGVASAPGSGSVFTLRLRAAPAGAGAHGPGTGAPAMGYMLLNS